MMPLELSVVYRGREMATNMMFLWLRTKLVRWAEQYQQRRIEQLLEEKRALMELLELNDGKPVTLSPEQREKLSAKRKGIDPKWLREIDALDMETDSPLGRD